MRNKCLFVFAGIGLLLGLHPVALPIFTSNPVREMGRLEKTAIQFRLQTTEKLAGEQKTLDVQRVRIELECSLRSEKSQREDLSRRVEDHFREVKQLRERNQQPEIDLAKIARVGKREGLDFADEARTWAGIQVSEKE